MPKEGALVRLKSRKYAAIAHCYGTERGTGLGFVLALALTGTLAQAEEAAPVVPPNAHQRGSRPRVPAATLPEDVPLPGAIARARASIAEGLPDTLLAKVVPDEQLAVLRAADRVLFPEPVKGITAGWAFALPRAEEAQGGLGLPLRDAALPREGLTADDTAWLRALTLPDLPVRLDRHVVTYLKFYRDSDRGRTVAAIFARKRGRFVSAMKATFRRAGLPSDLVWLSMIESGHDPTIASPAGAVGLWQFMPESARMYGLVVDRWVDERRDPARSTQAAARLLSDLYQRFGNWELAMAAYNMGYAGMSRAISKFNTNDYWTLSRLESGIPWETALYVPKIFALAIVMNNPREFGLGSIKADPAVSFDTILVEPGTQLKTIAQAAGISEDELFAINPAYLARRVPPAGEGALGGRSPVAVPKGVGAAVTSKLARTGLTRPRTVMVRFGDRVDTVAASYGVDREALLRENGLGVDDELAPFTVLVLPKGARDNPAESGRDAIVVSRKVAAGEGQRLVLYDVAAGDELSEIAAVFGVTEAELARDNALDRHARLRPGMTLQVVVPTDRALGSIRHQELDAELERLVLVSGSPEFHEYFEGLKGKRRTVVTVRKGDTLSLIGQRYGMTVGSMERVNRRSRKAPLLTGEQLVVYSEQSGAHGSAQGDPEPLLPLAPPRPELLPSALNTSGEAL